MTPETLKKPTLTFEELMFSSWEDYVKNLKKLIIIPLIGLAVIVAAMILAVALSFLSRIVAAAWTAPNYQILIYNLATKIVLFLLFLVLTSIFQILIVNILVNNKITLKQNLLLAKKHLWRFIILTLIFYLAAIIAATPLFSLLFLALFAPANIVIAAVFLFILFLIFICLAAVFLSLSPFILIDKNLKPLAAIKYNYALTKNIFLKTLGYIFLLWILLSIVNLIILFLNLVPVVNFIINLAYWLFILPFIFVYLFNLYKILDKK
jgi:hypothetical protein